MPDAGGIYGVGGTICGKSFVAATGDVWPGYRLRRQKKGILRYGGTMKAENIFLIGFMGTGKTTVSKALASLLPMEEMDTDAYIAALEGMSISRIFEEKGETYFRDRETRLLEELKVKKGYIISCGGGMALREENRQKMKEAGKVVLLTARPETILERVKDNDDRPLLQGRKHVEGIRELMDIRRERYEAAADITVATDHRKPADIAGEIVERIGGLV